MKSWKSKLAAFIAAVAAALGIGIGVPPSPTPSPEPVPTVAPTTAPTPPTPTAEPTAQPTAVPTAAPTPTTSPTPNPPFPVRFPIEGAVIYMRNHRYNAGVDSTPRVKGDPELCELIHGVKVNDCHFDNDKGLWRGQEERGRYEVAVLGGCPTWQVRGLRVERCHDDQNAQHSCDHFGNVSDRDDPKTHGVFEGKPESCGKQVDEFGPYAGFFMVPQKGEGRMEVRSCKPGFEGDESTCGPWVDVTWR